MSNGFKKWLSELLHTRTRPVRELEGNDDRVWGLVSESDQ